MSETSEQPAQRTEDKLENEYVEGAEQQHSLRVRSYRLLGISLYLLVYIVLGWFFPLVTGLVGGVLGIWLVAGSGPYWLRMLVPAVILYPALGFQPLGAALGGLMLGWTLLFTFLVRQLAGWVWQSLVPRAQYTLWDMGALVLTCAVLLAYGRACVAAYQEGPGLEWMQHVLMTLYCSVCCAVIGFPLLIPPSRRTTDMWVRVCGILFAGIPLLMGVGSAFIYFDIQLPLVLWVVNFCFACLLSMVLSPMELGGLFAASAEEEQR
ncbi:hypothetical protein [Blastopirellula marina]|uniref:Uncharacterized protein n=1 Tax=Blastopirellula marina TaxID=124 RepID=A0A2S8GP02_9BACT|nr:hypothetical protein [Blastopirellula marina]PQO46176.1 hypothetical protein C5Y93_09300 [Blastopirellula marina]